MRYFIEVMYHGRDFSGFQVQQNARTIQSELEAAMALILRQPVSLTGSSRTDAGVHAKQNFFHFDTSLDLQDKLVYNLNAVLPGAIAVLSLRKMQDEAHSRFDAIGRLYHYYLYETKNPFYEDRGWFYPFPLNKEVLNACATMILGQHDFTSFSKRNTQVKTMICTIRQSEWIQEGDFLVYKVQGNRFLRGMVRGLVATMLQAGRGKISEQGFWEILQQQDCSRADFAAPSKGLFLQKVMYPEGYFEGKV